MENFTEWFEPDIHPVHSGVYPTQFFNNVGYSRWVGNRWGSQYSTPEAAAIDGSRGSQNKRWRGLASDPAKGGA